MIKGVPLIRDVLSCRKKDHAEAAKEVVTTLAFSMLPIWLGALVVFSMAQGSVERYVLGFLRSGEALLIAAALIGPAIYTITKRYGDLPRSLTIHFPQGWFLVSVSVAICVITAAMFGLQRVYAQFGPPVFRDNPAPFESGAMVSLSSAILIATVLALYLVVLFKNYADDGAADAMRADTNEFLKEWNKQT